MSFVFDLIKQILAIPLGFILSLFYDVTSNYILAIVLLTLTVKLCFLPTAIGQQRTSAAMSRYNRKIREFQAKYKDEPERLKEALAALKEKEPEKKGNNGCLTSIIQFVVLIGLFGVIYTPLTNVLHIPNETLSEMKVIMADAITESGQAENMAEIVILKEADHYKKDLLENNVLSEEQLAELILFKEKYNFFGLDLSGNPKLAEYSELWLIPFLVFGISMVSTTYSVVLGRKRSPVKRKFMPIEALPYISPVMMFCFSFLFSAGVGLYWAISNLLSFIQMIILNIIYDPQKMRFEFDDFVFEDKASEVLSEYNEPLADVSAT